MARVSPQRRNQNILEAYAKLLLLFCYPLHYYAPAPVALVARQVAHKKNNFQTYTLTERVLHLAPLVASLTLVRRGVRHKPPDQYGFWVPLLTHQGAASILRDQDLTLS